MRLVLLLFLLTWEILRNYCLTPEQYDFYVHKQTVTKYFDLRKHWKTSNVGTMLFKNINPNTFAHLKKAKTFVILIWNARSVLYTDVDVEDTDTITNKSFLSSCSVNNCIFTRDRKYAQSADAVLTNVHRAQYPVVRNRNPKQKWVLMTMESPNNTFKGHEFPEEIKLKTFANKFNWIMSYRSDSDVPIPYGRVIPLNAPVKVNVTNPEHALSTLVPYWTLKQTKILIVIMISNCIFKDRIQFMTSLMKYMLVDAYGRCAVDKMLKKSCPREITSDCSVLPHYLFYLALENSSCRQYLTEKIYFNAFAKGAIPVIRGALLEDCKKLLPPQSFLHIDHFRSYEHLAQYLKYLSTNKTELLKYHLWRKHFKVSQEHGFLGTTGMQLCRLCEALNYNDDTRFIYNYEELQLFLDANITCFY